jgi:hypothetical protein
MLRGRPDWCGSGRDIRMLPLQINPANRALARKFHHLARKIGQGFDWVRNFPSERNNGVYFRVRKIPQTIKDSAKARHTGEIFGLAERRDIEQYPEVPSRRR